MKIFHYISIIIFIFFCLNCQKKSNVNLYANLFQTDEATKIQHYKQSGEWIQKVYNIDNLHIEFVKKLNKIDGFSVVPQPMQNIEEVQKQIVSIAQNFPKPVAKLFNTYLLGLYFCKDLGGTGISGFVYDKERKDAVGGFIIIDLHWIERNANDWISQKENTVFLAKKSVLNIAIEEPQNNNPQNALRYILLHEFGHILSVVKKEVPDFRLKKRNFKEYRFFKETWISENESIYDKEVFPFRSYVQFYGNKKINLDKKWELIYLPLQKTSFPTLYSAMNPDEQFAEAFVSYVHCVLEQKPWKLIISKEGEQKLEMGNGIVEERCLTIKSILDDVLYQN
ncbi:MAG: hypothetical protein KDK90_26600 [Leptospiraceae bacterium]|nr:hypothetical protein [Leptospiraceae bacterium]